MEAITKYRNQQLTSQRTQYVVENEASDARHDKIEDEIGA